MIPKFINQYIPNLKSQYINQPVSPVNFQVSLPAVAKKLLDRSPKPSAWLSSDDFLRPANEAFEWELQGIWGRLLGFFMGFHRMLLYLCGILLFFNGHFSMCFSMGFFMGLITDFFPCYSIGFSGSTDT